MPILSGFFMDYLSKEFVFIVAYVMILISTLLGLIALYNNEEQYTLVGSIFSIIGGDVIYRIIYIYIYQLDSKKFAKNYS